MKIEFIVDKIIIYLYHDNLDIDDIDSLNKKIKNLFVNLIKKYEINLFGYFKVSIYHNKNYGSILEIEPIYHCEFNMSTIDLKIIIYKNTTMYLEFNDWYFDSIPKNLIVKDHKYYLDINEIDKIEKYLEYAKIKYEL